MNQTAHVRFSRKMKVPQDLNDYSKYKAISIAVGYDGESLKTS